MADEKEIKSAEMTDEQTNAASGGLYRPETTAQAGMKQCANPGCNNMIENLPGNVYCSACQQKYNIRIIV